MSDDAPLPPRTATVLWKGKPFRVQEFRQLENGDWIMIALEKQPRFDVGHEVLARQHEITWD